mmetsp:Transcript_12308/g.23914  ORF Transcript_12308/g.23914 Transcript_12308/m.23914 type:complete len:236 (-) Transcript_12308:1016-1723(-)|eukprot:CAMPEP_0171485144 /NCGR_PEP_ID=MMETSP0958-20121227/383_1 /TAXON_ID=87120 /ORGANISM="Aurantiochytrium limacinum, Strain ATCCMYA-1381" /LENGTH=235 /DNA_ID=CAMNT_0012017903 /DNA_START=213 /DNA_END=920 /DNA_ORIENTATION=+
MRAALLCARATARTQRGAPVTSQLRGNVLASSSPSLSSPLAPLSMSNSTQWLSLSSDLQSRLSSSVSSSSSGESSELPPVRAWRARLNKQAMEKAALRKAESAAQTTQTTVVEHPSKLPFRDPNAPSKFAVVALSGTQYKVVEDDLIVCSLLDNAEVGEKYVIDDVLLVGGLDKTVIGRPRIAGATVTAMVEEITKDQKVIIMKRRTKNHKSRRTKGFRRDVTFLRIASIDYELK